jgi:hypothetical protein
MDFLGRYYHHSVPLCNRMGIQDHNFYKLVTDRIGMIFKKSDVERKMLKKKLETLSELASLTVGVVVDTEIHHGLIRANPSHPRQSMVNSSREFHELEL